jgi:addiction module RelE/StbE family toxin
LKTNWSAQAERDADEIWTFIAVDNPDAADRVIARFHSAVLALGEQPKMGRQGRIKGTREFAVSGTPYVLFYEIAAGTIEIRRVIHGARDWPPKRRRA